MKRTSTIKLSSGAGLDLTTARNLGSSSSSTHKTNSESITNSDVGAKKKSRRKVRCTQDFNLVDRTSIFSSTTTGSGSVKKVTTKKKKNLDFLPRVCLDTDCPVLKENFSSNIDTGSSGDEPRAKKTRRSKDVLKIVLPRLDMTVGIEKTGSLPRNADSTPEETRDSEIVFKKRKKKSKKTKSIRLGSPQNSIEFRIAVINEEKVSSTLPRKSGSVKTSILKTEKQRDLLEEIPVEHVKHSISSGDVYIEEINRTFDTYRSSSNAKVKMNPDLESERKSVRFRSTFEVQDITTNISGMKSITFEDFHRDEGSFKQYRKSPYVRKVSNKSARKLSPLKADNNRGNLAVISPSVRENAASKTTLSKTPPNRRSTFEMPSPILGPEKAVESLQSASFSRHKSENKEVSIINLLTPSPNKSERSNLGEATPSKLLRESTFTMDERVADRASESVQPLDITNSNGRRRWDKSLRVSFFDNSGNLYDISPPWAGEPVDLSASSCTPRQGKKTLSKESVPFKRSQKTTPTPTSTNLPANKKRSLRFELLKENCNGKTSESKNATSKRSKMPNFALIHQRAFDKLENLKEMSERKAARAKLLLSGLKPVSEAPVKAKSPAKSKKMLRYSPKPILPVTRTVRSPRNARIIAPSVSNPKVVPKLVEEKPMVSHIPKPAKSKNLAEKQKFTKLGFKVGAEAVKKSTREEQVKAVVNKSKVQTNTVDTRRNVIQNVRSNRRFELLMKMRNK